MSLAVQLFFAKQRSVTLESGLWIS